MTVIRRPPPAAGRLRGEEAETLMKQYPGDKDENVALVRQLLGLR